MVITFIVIRISHICTQQVLFQISIFIKHHKYTKKMKNLNISARLDLAFDKVKLKSGVKY